MTDTTVIEIISKALFLSMKIAGPILAITLAIGLLVGIIQAATSIQEQTLTFVPKLIAIGAVVLLSGNWMISEVVSFTQSLFQMIPQMVKG
ncbi:MAG: flagellar biosynthesis protein FliQ [Acidimicrobiia bacterium]